MICEFPSIKKEILIIEKEELEFEMDNDDMKLSIFGPCRSSVETVSS